MNADERCLLVLITHKIGDEKDDVDCTTVFGDLTIQSI